MKIVYARCAGLDVHKKTVHAHVRIRKSNKITTDAAVFGTFTEDLQRLSEWLRKHKVRRLVMESTGVYWVPVWNILESSSWKFDLVLVNPQHVHALPGRKTDQADCERLAELGQYDLVRGSFIPPAEIRELRDLTRRRTSIQHDRNRVINRISRWLETANIKLASVVSSITGKTGLAILRAIAHGASDGKKLAELAQGSLKHRKAELASAVNGRFSPHFRWLLGELLDDLERLDRKLSELDSRIAGRMKPYEDLIGRLCTIPSVQQVTAWTIIAELGTDASRFADAAHAASWAALCPGNCESAGKRQTGRTRKGNRYLKSALVQNGWAVAKMKNCPLTAVFYRVARRQGMKKAAIAVAHKVLVIAWYIIRDGTVYRGGDQTYTERRRHDALRLLHRLEYALERLETRTPLRPKAPAATPEECPKCSKWGIPCVHGWKRELLERRTQMPQST